MQDIQKPKVLCLSFWTPPIVRPQSILIGKMIPEWISQGLKPFIVTYDACGNWDIGASLFKIPAYHPHINRYFANIPGARNIWALGAEYRYYRDIASTVARIAREHDIHIVYSFSNPQASNIVGAMVKRRLGIKFVSHFSDPWYDNPYQSFSKIKAMKALKLEKFIIGNSDKIIFTNSQAKDLVMKKYPLRYRERAEVVPHCYAEKDYPQVLGRKKEKFILSYIGAFYKKRNPESLFLALHSAMQIAPHIVTRFTLKLVGIGTGYTDFGIEDLRAMIKKYELGESIEIIPQVTYRESLRYMKEADCLIVIDANFSASPFFPSKVVDYAGSGTEIIGITPKNSPTEEFLQELGYHAFHYGQIDALARYMIELISQEIRPQPNRDFLRQFDVRATTQILIKEFHDVLKE